MVPFRSRRFSCWFLSLCLKQRGLINDKRKSSQLAELIFETGALRSKDWYPKSLLFDKKAFPPAATEWPFGLIQDAHRVFCLLAKSLLCGIVGSLCRFMMQGQVLCRNFEAISLFHTVQPWACAYALGGAPCTIFVRADHLEGEGVGTEILKKRPDISIFVAFSSGRFRSRGGCTMVKNLNIEMPVGHQLWLITSLTFFVAIRYQFSFPGGFVVLTTRLFSQQKTHLGLRYFQFDFERRLSPCYIYIGHMYCTLSTLNY